MERILLAIVVLVLAGWGAWWALSDGAAAPPPAVGVGTDELDPEVESPVSSRGGEGASGSVERSEVGETWVPIDRNGSGTLRVRVRSGGHGLAGIAVRAQRFGDDATASARDGVTARDGVVRFEGVPTGRWRVSLARRGQDVRKTTRVSSGSVATVDFSVETGPAVDVRVEHASGAIAADAEVWLWPPGMRGHFDASMGRMFGKTDSLGMLRVVPLAGGAHVAPRIGARLRGYASSPIIWMRDLPPVVTLRLGEREMSVRGLVLHDGEPVEDALVSFEPPRAATRSRTVEVPGAPPRVETERVRRNVRTDDRGRFEFTGLRPGFVFLKVRAAGLSPAMRRIELSDAERDVELTIEMTSGALVSGEVVTPAGAPVPGADVVVALGRATTESTGRFEIDGLPVGPVEWRARAKDHVAAEGRIELIEGRSNRLRIELTPRTRVTGRLLAQDRTPIQGWTVALAAIAEHEGEDGRSAETGTDGAFELATLPDVGYSITVREPGQFLPTSFGGPNFVIDSAEGLELIVRDEDRATAGLRGFVVDTDGRPLAVSFQVRGGAFLATPGATMSDAKIDESTGAFEIGPLPPGRFTLFVRSLDGAFARFHRDVFLVANDVVDVGRLVPPLAGVVEIEPTVPVGRDNVRVFAQFDVLDDLGRLRGGPDDQQVEVLQLPAHRRLTLPGRYRLTLYGEGFRSIVQQVDVRADEVLRLTPTLPAAVRVPLRISLPDGEDSFVFEVLADDGTSVLDGEVTAVRTNHDALPALSVGTYTIDGAGSSGQRYVTNFDVESLAPSKVLLQPKLRPTR